MHNIDKKQLDHRYKYEVGMEIYTGGKKLRPFKGEECTNNLDVFMIYRITKKHAYLSNLMFMGSWNAKGLSVGHYKSVTRVKVRRSS